MDVETLARIQFAFTIMFHYIYPPLSIGLGLILVLMEGTYLATGEIKFRQMAQFWTKIFALTFALGVATGIVMEFEFGTNWAAYSRYVGDIFGSALAAEGVFAFFLESGFLAILLFGWTRVHPRTHFFATLMVCLGAHFSAIWIVVANSWMQTPAGFTIVGEGIAARAQITDFWEMVFNPSSMTRLFHTVVGAWLAGAFLVISVSAYYLLKKRHLEFARQSMKIALGLALVSLILQLYLGDQSGKIVAKYQPAKLAAMEGLYQTSKGAPLSLFGLPNSSTQTLDYEVSIPKMLSYLTFGDFEAEIKGLDQFPKKDWPNVPAVFQTYHLMILCWGAMMLVTVLALLYWRKGKIQETPWLLWALIFSVFLPQVGNQAGWVTAEMGRYPWIVYDLLRISQGLSESVSAGQILGSIIMFGLVYALLFVLFIYLLNEKIQHGPEDQEMDGSPYHFQRPIAEKAPHDATV